MSLRTVRRLLACSLFIVAVYWAFDLAGRRASAALLCRIDAPYAASRGELLGLGLYLASYFGFVFVAPVLTLAAGLLWVAATVRHRRRNSAKADEAAE